MIIFIFFDSIIFAKIGRRYYLLLNRRPKQGENFFELPNKGNTRQSYYNTIYKCVGGTDNYIFSSQEINHPFPENCYPILSALWNTNF